MDLFTLRSKDEREEERELQKKQGNTDGKRGKKDIDRKRKKEEWKTRGPSSSSSASSSSFLFLVSAPCTCLSLSDTHDRRVDGDGEFPLLLPLAPAVLLRHRPPRKTKCLSHAAHAICMHVDIHAYSI